MFQPFKVAGEDTEKSIVGRLRSSISDEDGRKFREYLDRIWTAPEMVVNRTKFNEWKKPYEKMVIGSYIAHTGYMNQVGIKRWQSVLKELERNFENTLKV